jgi:hypothetical protein
MKDNINILEFERDYLNSKPLWQSETFKERWKDLPSHQKLEYIMWVHSNKIDRTQPFGTFLMQPGRGAGWDEESITFFEKNPNDSLKPPERGGSSRRRRRRSIPSLRANTRNPPSAYLGRNRVRRGGGETRGCFDSQYWRNIILRICIRNGRIYPYT